MTAENAEFKMTYLDLQAYAGVAKHMGGFEATNELLSLCHIKNAQEVLDVGCGIGVGPAYIAKTYGCRVVGVDVSEEMIEWSRQRAKQEGVEDRVEFRTAEAWQALWEGSGLQDRVVRIYQIDARTEIKSRIRWIGWSWILKAWYRVLSLYLKNAGARQFIKEQLDTPREMFGYLGYGLFVGRKSK